MKRIASIVAMLVVLLAALPAVAQDAAPAPEAIPGDTPLRVGVYVSPPFVVETDGGYSGMAIDLWERLAAELGVEFVYQPFATIRDLVDATAGQRIDVAVTNLTITQGRAERMDFTQPWFDAGLRLMVDASGGTGIGDVLNGLNDAGYLWAYAWLGFIIVVATILLTLFDRRFDSNFPRRWRDGLAESFFSVMSVATSGRTPARKNLFGWAGRIWSAVWLVCGIAVLAYVTSSVTSVMTTLSLSNQIASLDDVAGARIGVFTGSVAEEFARQNGLRTVSYPGIDEAVTALRSDRIKAIVGDAPVLEYYAFSHPDQTVDVVGNIFEPDKYGFGLPQGSPLARPLTVRLLGAHESDLIEDLHNRYFGDEHL